MESLLLILVLALLVFPVWAIIRIITLGRQNNAIAQKLEELERELARMRQSQTKPATAARAHEPAHAPATNATEPRAAAMALSPVSSPPAPVAAAVPTTTQPATAKPAAEIPATPPPLPQTPAPAPLPPLAHTPEPPLPRRPFQPSVTQAAVPAAKLPPPVFARINWEQFMGVKLFAWLGGFAAFLGATFLVRYSFEHNWIPPEVRVAAGFIFGIGLVVGGLKVPRRRYAVTAQTLIATGIVSLYAVTFACDSIYHFAFFSMLVTFAVMALITATAFLLAVRLEARVVAVLGMLGGFLTPVLLSTGQDNPAGLFGYLALLDLGLIAVALHRRWHFLVPLGALGTLVMQIAWAGKFFSDAKAGVAVIICLGFAAVFLGACAVARRRGGSSPHLLWSAAGLACVCFGFALFFNSYAALRDRPGLIFSFALLADLCLFGLAWIERRPAMFGLAALGAALVEIGWTAETLNAARAPTAMAVSLIFCAVFLAAYFVARAAYRRGAARTPIPREITWSAAAVALIAILFSFAFLNFPAIAARPGLLLGYTLLADACVLALAWCDEQVPKLHLISGVAVFAVLAAWISGAITAALLPWALAFLLGYAALHTAFPLLLERHRPAAAPTWWSQLFPPLTLGLMLVPLLKFDVVSFALWPCILLVDVIAIGATMFTGSLVAIAAVLLLTLGATGVWIFRVPVELAPAPELLVVIAAFAVFFFAAALYVSRRLAPKSGPANERLQSVFGDTRTQLPALSALLPFVLLVMMTQRLPLANPSPVFGLALLLVILTLGLSCVMTLEWLPACALVGTAALEYAWQARHFGPEYAGLSLFWYVVFYAVFSAFPFAFRRRFASLTGPWAVAAVGGVAQFPLVYHVVRVTWPNGFMGLLPAALAVVPLLSLMAVLRFPNRPERTRLNQLAVFGGVALLFITLIFPIQFERQWLTIAWALEGAALLWLYHRVPHRGLEGTGVISLVVAFVRLAANPAVLEYHARSTTALLNWYLYSYGLVTAALFVGAKLAAAPRDRVLGFRIPPLLNTLGTVLAFLLLNLEIADYFSTPGARVLTFEFSGNFARDMTYTIAWSGYALGLLLVSMWRGLRPGRYAALALLSVALVKLFFHDLARLDSLYRIGALFAVAVIAIIASVAYQRYLPANDKPASPP